MQLENPKAVENPLEKAIAKILFNNGINYIREGCSGNKRGLDFYLPDYDVFIEVKAGYTERSDKQLKNNEAVILIQDKKSIDFLLKVFKMATI